MRRLFVAALLGAALWAQPQSDDAAKKRLAYIEEHYTKSEYMVPMRDGVRLFTSVYEPKDRSSQYPILLNRTPYTVRPYGVDQFRSMLAQSGLYAKEGFIFAYQDVRGRGRSEGVFEHVRPYIPNKRGPKDIDESSDAYDTVDWLIRNVKNHNGRVGAYGISYPGFYAAMTAIDAHPAVKAVSPQAPVTDWFVGDDFRHNGVIFLIHAFNFLSFFGQPKDTENVEVDLRYPMRPADAYEFFIRMGPLQNVDEKLFQGKIAYWKELLENDTYSTFWQARNARVGMKNVKPAVMTVGGWFDAEDLYGALRLYEAAEKNSPGANNTLVMGPWIHGGWARNDGDRLGDVRFRQNTSQFYQEKIEFPFFLHHLKGKGDGAKLPEAYMFETGRNEWHALDAWPPKDAKPKTLYFQANGKLGWNPPDSAANAFDEYVSDPLKPVPFIGKTTQQMDVTYMVADQRFAASRPDVLVYETEPLETDVRVAGPLKAKLHVSTTGTDADWVVKLIDVYPGDYPNNDPNPAGVLMAGYQQLVRGEPFRGKFRKGFDNPQPFTPGKMDVVEFELPDVFHTFRRGHRIMVQVQSSWFPLGDRNPQKFMKIHEARSEDFVKATHRVFRGPTSTSGLTILTVE